eukprot:55212_1
MKVITPLLNASVLWILLVFSQCLVVAVSQNKRGDDDRVYPSRPLRMYWKRGYTWQEETQERFWCMQCTNDCHRPREPLRIRKCRPPHPRQIWTRIGSTIRPNSNRNACVTRVSNGNNGGGGGGSNKVYLAACVGGRGSAKQQWDAMDMKDKFELKVGGRCLSQHHHPRSGEFLYMENCKTARVDRSSYWMFD